jgi:hypothetical protein
VVAAAGDYTAAQVTGAVPNTIQVIAGTGMTGGGPLTGNVTLNANVTSVFGRTGAVVLTAADISAGGGVAATRQVLAGAGLTGGGNLGSDVTLTASVVSVFGRTGSVTLTATDVTGVGGVLNTRQVIAGTGLTGGGALSADVTVSIVPKTVNQLLAVQQAGTAVGTRPTLNFISTGVLNMTVADNPSNTSVDVTFGLASTAMNILVNGVSIGTRPTLNLIASSNVTISGSDNSTNNRVDITVAAVGGTGGGGSQTPWLQDVDAGTFALYDVNYVSVNRTKDTSARVSINTGAEDGLKVTSASAAGQAQMHLVNSDGSAHLFLDAWGASATAGPPSTSGLNTTGALVFLTNNTEAVRISTAQRVLIGTTTDDGTNKLQVNGRIKSLTGGIVFPDNTVQTTAAVAGMTDPTTTKGDMIVHGATTTRLPVGADNLVLTADSTQSLGVSWKAAAGGVASVFGRTGAVVAQSGDYTVAQVTGAVPNTVQVIAGTGLSGGGALSGNVTLTGAAFHASGSSHASGDVPDPGATAGTTRYLREDATWVVPPYPAVMVASGASHASGLAPDPGATAGTTRFLCENATWVAPPNTAQTPWAQDVNAAGFRLYNTGRVIIGSSTDDASNLFQVVGSVAQYNFSGASANSGTRYYGIAARGTQAAPVALANGDALTYFVGEGFGTAYTQGGYIGIIADAAWSVSSGSAYMNFATTPSGSTTPQERMRINSAGQVLVGTQAATSDYPLQVIAPASGNGLSVRCASALGYAGIDCYAYMTAATGGQNSGGEVDCYSARGTIAAPTATQANDYIAYFGGNGHTGSAFHGGAGISMFAGSTWTTSNWEAYITFTTSPNSGSMAERMRIASNGRVGIGVTAPGYALDVFGAAVTSTIARFKAAAGSGSYVVVDTGDTSHDSGIFFYINGVWNTEIDSNTDGSMAFWGKTASAPVTISSVGNLGVGDTNPLCKISTGTNLAPIKVSAYDGTNSTCYGMGVASNNLTFGASIDPNNGAPQMYLSSSGNLSLGGGASSPTRLWVQAASQDLPLLASWGGTAVFYSSSSVGIEFGCMVNGPYSAWIQAKAINNNWFPLALNPAGGPVVVGSNTDAGYPFEVVFSSGSLPIRITRGGNYSYIFFDGTSTGFGDAGGAFRIGPVGNQGARVMCNSGIWISGQNFSHYLELSADDAVKPSTNTWGISSDIRLKRNIRRFEGDMEIIRRLDPIVAEYNGLGGTPEGARVVSFDTRALKQLIPEAVGITRERLNPTDEDRMEFDTMNTHEIFFHMLRAIQMLDARLMALEKN